MTRKFSSPPHLRLDVRPTLREIRWFGHIDRHGPQSSKFLYELTRNTHRCRDSALRRLQALREAGYLLLPRQQRQIAKAEFNPYVYDLSRLGWEVLADHQNLERHCRPTGHWWHCYWVSAVSSAVEIKAARADLSYIPAAQILAITTSSMGLPLNKFTLIPDQLFAIKYPAGYRAFALEVDRGSEPVRSRAARKSLQKSVMQYQQVLNDRLYRRHWGLKSNLAVLWVFTNARRRTQFSSLLEPGERRFRYCASESSFLSWYVSASLVDELDLV
ncbi:replication-relaxation family protein [Jannaschia sp. KMU-145]|uniref:replication-relaxation family protein n=1 Tax=Jannaschia halovivens TaxID=3388667 RepID=UPI00396AF516